jgi:AraC-like DNA-binding protein
MCHAIGCRVLTFFLCFNFFPSYRFGVCRILIITQIVHLNIPGLGYVIVSGLCIYALIYLKKIVKKQKRLPILPWLEKKKVYNTKIDVLTSVAHEIHAPLTLITVLLAEIENSEDLAEIKNNAALIHKNTRRLISLANQLPDLRKNNVPARPAINCIACTKTDEAFIAKLNQAINENLANPGLDIDYLAGILNLSRRSLFRKIKSIDDVSPAEMINALRLKKAAVLLLCNDNKVYEIADLVGFKSRSCFTRNFTRQFGMSPTEYVRAYSQDTVG